MESSEIADTPPPRGFYDPLEAHLEWAHRDQNKDLILLLQQKRKTQ